MVCKLCKIEFLPKGRQLYCSVFCRYKFWILCSIGGREKELFTGKGVIINKLLKVSMSKYELTKEQYEKVKYLIETEDKKFSAIEDLVGNVIFIRTVTHYYTGRLAKIAGCFAILEEAAWIGDTGRFSNFLKGENDSNLEVEPMGTTLININAIIDITPYKKTLISQI